MTGRVVALMVGKWAARESRTFSPAADVLKSMSPVEQESRPESKKIYVIGFQADDPIKARLVTDAGLDGVAPDDMPASIYELLAWGDFGGSLIHTPNVYDFPVALI